MNFHVASRGWLSPLTLAYLHGGHDHIVPIKSFKIILARFACSIFFINLMPRLHLPRSSYDLFVYDFPCDCIGIVGGFKLQRKCFHCLRSPCDFFRRQTRTKPHGDHADIVRQQQCYRTVIVFSSRPPHINRTMTLRKSQGVVR